MTILSCLNFSEMISPNLMSQLTPQDNLLIEGISKIIQQLLQENFTGALSELNLLSSKLEGRIKDLKDQIVIRLNFPRSAVEIAAMIKILTLPFINGVKPEDKKKLTDKFKQELEKVSRLASFYEGSHRNMKVDCPMSLSQAFLSGRMQCSRFGQCDLHVFNATDQTPMTLTSNPYGRHEHPTKVTLKDVAAACVSSDKEFLFNGNIRNRTHLDQLFRETSAALTEGFCLSQNAHRAEHIYMAEGGVRVPVDPDSSFDIYQTEIGESSPIRGLTIQEYALLKSCTRIYANGRIVAFDLALIIQKVDRLFPISIQRYLRDTGFKGLVLSLEGSSYHIVHLTAPFKWNTAIPFLTSEINDFWRTWNTPKQANANNEDTLNSVQRTAYTARFLVQSSLFRTSDTCHITLNDDKVVIRDSKDQTNIITYAVNVIESLPQVLDPIGILFRDIISGQKPTVPLVEPLPNRLRDRLITTYSINPSLYVGFDGRDALFIDAAGVQSNVVEYGGNSNGITEIYNSTINLAASLSQNGFRSITFQGTPRVVTVAGENIPLKKLTNRPFYPNFLLKRVNEVIQKVINSTSISSLRGTIFDVIPLKILVLEYAADEEFISQAEIPEQMRIPASLCDREVLKLWSRQSTPNERFVPQPLQDLNTSVANPLGAAAVAAAATRSGRRERI